MVAATALTAPTAPARVLRPVTRYVPNISLTTTSNETTTGLVDTSFDLMYQGWPPRAIDVQVDLGGRHVRALARSAVQNADGSITLQNVHYYGVDGAFEPTGGWNWPTTATNTAGTITLNSNIATATNTITIRTGATAATDAFNNLIVFDYSGMPVSKRPYKPKPQIVNHRGQPARSAEKGQLWSRATPEELTALQLLRQMVSSEEFRRYLKHAFVNVKGPSGLIYQISRSELIKVWDNGELVCTLCVHLKDWYDKPPTDQVIAKLLIAEMDEPDLWKRANVNWRTADKDRPGLHAIGRGEKPLTIFTPEEVRRSMEPIYRFGT